jgi:hypothetical protein
MPIVPVNLVVTPFSERGQAEPSTWTGTDPTDALRVANTIWMAANIQFHRPHPSTRRHSPQLTTAGKQPEP